MCPYEWPKIHGFPWGDFTPINGSSSNPTYNEWHWDTPPIFLMAQVLNVRLFFGKKKQPRLANLYLVGG